MNSLNRLTEITYPDSTTTQYAYDTRGRLTSVTDGNSNTTTYTYDDADRLIKVTDAANNKTYYAYDTENNLTSITDAASHETMFSYGDTTHPRLVTKTTFPVGSTPNETYSYDAVGNLATKTDRNGNEITYSYDQLNRLITKTYPGATTVSYTYDLDSHLTELADGTGTYILSYDNMGRLTQSSTTYSISNAPTSAFTNQYAYDAASNRTSLTYPQSGGSIAYVYDTLNRLSSLTNSAGPAFNFSYDALSRRTQMTRSNGITTNYSYDSVSNLLSVLHRPGRAFDGASYTYDSAGNRTAKTDKLTNQTSNYRYDNIYELTQVLLQNSIATESYSYDAVGNRTNSGYSTNSSNELTASPGDRPPLNQGLD